MALSGSQMGVNEGLREVDNIPDAERLVDSLRSSGYAFKVALADIVDNSIVANANNIKVRVEMEFDGKVVVAVGDDGCGMDEPKLEDALKYGSAPPPDPSCLSKFGLGLKTASTAFCRRLSVISRSDPKASWKKAIWDLDHVAYTRQWKLLMGTPTAEELTLVGHLCGEIGTLVLWDKIDRLQKKYAQPGGKSQKNDLDKRATEARDHLAMVFQRFLDKGDNRARSISININGENIAPWDPFCVAVSDLIHSGNIKFKMDDGTEVLAPIRSYVLPRQEDFPTKEDAVAARLANEMQGVYIYRENRLIDGPHYLGLFVQEPHRTLCRVELSFSYLCDDPMGITFQKSRVDPWPEIRDELRKLITPARRAAEERYRKGSRKRDLNRTKDMHKASNRAIDAKAEDVRNAQLKTEANGTVTLQNKNGATPTGEIELVIEGADEKTKGVYVLPVEQIQDGLLWEPVMISDDANGREAVHLNVGHPYYRKVYLPHVDDPAIVQKLDLLIWALGTAELGTISQKSKEHFMELRFELSKVLRRLVEDMPDPLEPGDEDDEGSLGGETA